MKSKIINIAGRNIGENHSPYIIAELSANHNGKLENALHLIDAASKAGADAVKLQTYRPDTITLNCDGPDFKIKGGLWDGRTLYELYEQAHMPWDWHKPLFQHAKKRGVTIFSTPFDHSAVDFLEDLNAPAYKIASFEATDLPLIRYVAATKKPMIISTGMAGLDEIAEAIEAATSSGCTQLALLHCVSGYPAPVEEYNLKTMTQLARNFGLLTGLSDHTLGNTTALAAVALGASLIEKHFTLDRHGGGPDDSFSIEPSELATLCDEAKAVWKALGTVNFNTKPSEKGNIGFRRSLYFIKDMNVGDMITSECIKSVRPGYGLPPKYHDALLGRKIIKQVKRNTPTDWTYIDEK